MDVHDQVNRFITAPMSRIERRSFLIAPFQLAAAVGITGAGAKILGANDTVHVAVVGIGGRGRDHIQSFGRQENCRIDAVCDVNQEARERAVALVEKAQGHKPKEYSDMRRLFEDKQIDAVSFATPNHWHALGMIWACQAGKDVYVEKPACHNIWEGGQMIKAARKYQRIVQVGSQSRSTAFKMKAVELLKQGVIGKIYMAKGLCYKWRPSIGHTPNTPVPPGINWEQFLGPAPMRPFSMNRYKYNWHWFWDTGNGDLGNQGVHEMDICRWVLGETGAPKTAYSAGGKYISVDDQETPNTQWATFDYGDFRIEFEVRGLVTGGESGVEMAGGNFVGNVFYGSEGCMAVDGRGYRVFKGRKREKVIDERPAQTHGGYDTDAHFVNFLKAVRSRNPKDLNADIEVGVRSASMCHLANVSYRLGRQLSLSPNKWEFANDAEANRMLTRAYRAPYVVPANV